MSEIENAQIESAFLGYEGHGILTSSLMTNHNGFFQSYGEYGLDEYDRENKTRAPSLACGLWIHRVLETVGVTEWGELQGKYIRIKRERSMIVAIGHITEDKWFNAKEEFDELFGRSPKMEVVTRD